MYAQINGNTRLILYFVETKNKISTLSNPPRLSMKLNYHQILLACLISFSTIAFSANAYAQDAHYPTIEEIKEDDTFMTWSETDPKNSAVKTPKDSAVANTKSPRTIKIAETKSTKTESEQNSKEKDEEDDSVLSFNFLYYIFQKYKLQDIVD